MKRISIMGLMFVAILAVSGGAASSASAVICARDPGHGNFKNAACTQAAVNGGYTEVIELGKEIEAGTWCAKVKPKTGEYKDNECKTLGGEEEFVKVKLGWLVNGTLLAKGATVALANTAAVDESTVLNEPSLGVRLTCSGSVLEGTKPFIQGTNNGGAESLTFTNCSELAPSTCTIQSTIPTEPVVASVELGTAPLDRIRFAPKTGKVFATIEFKGTCAEAGDQPVDGQVVADSKTGQEENTTQPLEGLGTTENNSLELLGHKAYLVGGKALLKLASGSPWSFGLSAIR